MTGKFAFVERELALGTRSLYASAGSVPTVRRLGRDSDNRGYKPIEGCPIFTANELFDFISLHMSPEEFANLENNNGKYNSMDFRLTDVPFAFIVNFEVYPGSRNSYIEMFPRKLFSHLGD